VPFKPSGRAWRGRIERQAVSQIREDCVWLAVIAAPSPHASRHLCQRVSSSPGESATNSAKLTNRDPVPPMFRAKQSGWHIHVRLDHRGVLVAPVESRTPLSAPELRMAACIVHLSKRGATGLVAS
jgi:hypothetical protein